MYEALKQLDPIRIHFSASGMHSINIILGFIMFGVALGIKPTHFKELIKEPKTYFLGLLGHLVALPLMTFLLVVALNEYIPPTIAMGMFLVAACPGGNISNFMTSYAKGNAELSVGLSASTTLLATFSTPFNFAFWGGIYLRFISTKAGHLLQPLQIDNFQLFETVFILLGIPLITGIFFARFFPRITLKLKKPIQYLSIVFFISIVLLSFATNWNLFIKYIFYIFFIVLIHNFLAFLTGYSLGSLFNISTRDRRTITLEMGIQNSGLGLVLLFNPKIFPPSLAVGGMLFITAWWGIWHIIAGLSLSTYWSRHQPE
jgi:BASS family bile acid:Na+ symporter